MPFPKTELPELLPLPAEEPGQLPVRELRIRGHQRDDRQKGRMTAPHEQGSDTTAIERESNPYDVLNTRDVAKIMRCGVRKVQRMAALGLLPMKLFGGEFIITRKRLDEYLDS